MSKSDALSDYPGLKALIVVMILTSLAWIASVVLPLVWKSEHPPFAIATGLVFLNHAIRVVRNAYGED